MVYYNQSQKINIYYYTVPMLKDIYEDSKNAQRYSIEYEKRDREDEF